MKSYQQKQKETVAKIEEQIQNQSLSFSTVAPVTDYFHDKRLCLTSVHDPSDSLKESVHKEIIAPLQPLLPDAFFYPKPSLHITLKTIRTIHDPPEFTKEDIHKVAEVFAAIVPKHKRFRVYFYRLLLFPHSLALIGTTDEELDKLMIALDTALAKAGVPDTSKYVNKKIFF